MIYRYPLCMNEKVILFDADGIAIICERFSSRMEKDHGTPWEVMKPFFDGPFAQCKIGKADLKTELQKVMREWKWTGSVEELMDYWFKIGLIIDNNIINLVNKLRTKGVKCCLATNQTVCRADYLRNDLGLGKIFDGFYTSADMGYMKDVPTFFERVLANLGGNLPGHEVLFVDNE